MNFKITKILTLVAAIVGAALYFTSNISAVGDLVAPRDVISDMSLGGFATHTIRFGLPVTADPIQTTDYIVVSMPDFSGPTEPVFIGGTYLGTPVYTVWGSRVTISGIYVSPGNYITINGITAFNPEDGGKFDVYLSIGSDPTGQANVRNQAHILALASDNSVTVSSQVEAQIGVLKINGLASPNMFISFMEGNVVIGTTYSDSGGIFTQSFPAIAPGLHNIQIYGTDSLNRTTPSVSVEIVTRAFDIITYDGVILAPVISIDKDEIHRGDTIRVSGSGPRGFKAKIFTESPLESWEVAIGNDGTFQYDISDTLNMDYGDHKVYALVFDGLGSQSLMSITSFFKVLSESPNPGQTACDISTANLNCDADGLIDLKDFSILLYYWGSNSAAADINSDGGVNLIDFSIMMYYWSGE